MVERFKKIRIWLARCLASDFLREREEGIDRRLAEIALKQDPFEPFIKRFSGIFGKEYEMPEDGLDARSQLLLKSWGYQQRDDPSFKYIVEWIMNRQGNETLKRAPVTPERIMYGRAAMANMVQYRDQVIRLAEAYEDELAKNKVQEFSSELAVEE